jgi:hypothetical protein
VGIAGDMSNILQGGTVTAPAPPATGATAGSPGSFTPAGSTAPANLAAMTGIVAAPATAWTAGQYVVLGDSSHAAWDADSWEVAVVAELGSDPATATVQQVKDYVTAHPDERDRILAEEEAGQNRVTLTEWLTAFTPG